MQTEEEAIKIDKDMRKMLNNYKIKFNDVDTTKIKVVDTMVKDILNKLRGEE